MISLPVDEHIKTIIKHLEESKSLVLTSSPGSGKTTRVAPALAEHFSSNKIIMLQPRRVAARSTCQRIAEERSWELGERVGYQMRFENKSSRGTQLLICTEGLLTKKIQQNPTLEDIDLAILDEFHERSLHLDFALAWLKNLQETRRPDLKILVMSATIDIDAVSKFLGGCPTLKVSGKVHPLEIISSKHSFNIFDRKVLLSKITELILNAIQKSPESSALVFLPGVGEIQHLQKTLLEAQKTHDVLPLHGSLPSELQDKALRNRTKPRVVLATNIAETSVTVEGVHLVIDSGLEKMISFDAKSGVETLGLRRISQASADQRAGRAARLGPGTCYRLWTQGEQNGLEKFTAPEIVRTDFLDLLLSLLSIQKTGLDWLTPPPAEFRDHAENVSRVLGLVRDSELTSLGHASLKLPASARISLLLLYGKAAKREKIAALAAALLSERDFLTSSLKGFDLHDKNECDLSLRIEVLNNLENFSSHEYSAKRVARVQKLAHFYENSIAKTEAPEEISELKLHKNLGALLLLSFADRLTRRRDKHQHKGLMSSGRGILLSENSCVQKDKLFLSLDVQNRGPAKQQRESLVSLASSIHPSWIRQFFADQIEKRTWVEEERGQAKAFSAEFFLNLAIEDPKPAPLDENTRRNSRIDRITSIFPQVVGKNSELAHWVSRLSFAKNAQPEMNWPELDKDSLQSMIEMALDENKNLKAETKALAKFDFVPFLEMLFTGSQMDFFSKMIPEKIHFAQRLRRVEYPEGLPPKLQVILQDVIGIKENPKLGETVVSIEILAPSRRPIQLTSNLGTFWKNSYPEIRKQYRGRYPKHHWPENP